MKEMKPFQDNPFINGVNQVKISLIIDGDVLDYYWATMDSKRIPRKLDEGGTRIKDFIMNTYSEDPIPDEVFHLPEYCQSSNACPSTTVCGKFQSNLIVE